MTVHLRANGADVNAVRLRGRLSVTPERRTLPSGDEVVRLRLVVRRSDGAGVDAIDVSVGPAPAPGKRRHDGQVGRRLLASAARLRPDQRLEVVGELQRRWWAAGGARRSRLEVRATAVLAVDGGPDAPDVADTAGPGG